MDGPATATARLVVLRGNSGSGKSTVARRLRGLLGRGVAWVEQDYLRRIVLHEHDVPCGVNIGLVDQTVRYALRNGYHVVLEGMLDAGRYGTMLAGLRHDFAELATFFYLDVSFEETVRRHATRPQAADFCADDMRAWYRERDLLPFLTEEIVPETWTVDHTVDIVIATSGLVGLR